MTPDEFLSWHRECFMRAPTTTWIVTRAFLAMPRWFKRWLVGVVTDAVDADEKVDCAAYDELE